jgi:hypothetical protein
MSREEAALKLQQELLLNIMEATLPLLEDKLSEEHQTRIRILEKVIRAKDEDKEFFKSPVAYFIKHHALSIQSITLPVTGKVIELVDDKATIKYVREMREAFKAGKSIMDIAFCPDVPLYRHIYFYETRRLWAYRKSDCWRDRLGLEFIEDMVKDIDLGPLVSNEATAALKEYVKAIEQEVVR